MSLSAIRAAIVAKLAAVPDIGRVHNYERFAAHEKQFRELYATAEGRILGWHVRRVATREVSGAVGISMQVVTWRLTGVMALADAGASELAFDDRVEAVRDAFRADETLGGVVADICDLTAGEGEKEHGIQVERSEPVMFAGVLCHRVQLALTTSNPLQF